LNPIDQHVIPIDQIEQSYLVASKLESLISDPVWRREYTSNS
jgi:hypothetical protein